MEILLEQLHRITDTQLIHEYIEVFLEEKRDFLLAFKGCFEKMSQVCEYILDLSADPEGIQIYCKFVDEFFSVVADKMKSRAAGILYTGGIPFIQDQATVHALPIVAKLPSSSIVPAFEFWMSKWLPLQASLEETRGHFTSDDRCPSFVRDCYRVAPACVERFVKASPHHPISVVVLEILAQDFGDDFVLDALLLHWRPACSVALKNYLRRVPTEKTRQISRAFVESFFDEVQLLDLVEILSCLDYPPMQIDSYLDKVLARVGAFQDLPSSLTPLLSRSTPAGQRNFIFRAFEKFPEAADQMLLLTDSLLSIDQSTAIELANSAAASLIARSTCKLPVESLDLFYECLKLQQPVTLAHLEYFQRLRPVGCKSFYRISSFVVASLQKLTDHSHSSLIEAVIDRAKLLFFSEPFSSQTEDSIKEFFAFFLAFYSQDAAEMKRLGMFCVDCLSNVFQDWLMAFCCAFLRDHPIAVSPEMLGCLLSSVSRPL